MTLTWYLRTGDMVAHHLLPRLVAAIIDRDTTVTATPMGEGAGWAACDLTSDRLVMIEAERNDPDAVARAGLPLRLQINTQPDVVGRAREIGLAEGGPGVLRNCDALAELTISGYLIDWATVGSVHAAAVELWSGIAYTEAVGFDVRLPAD